MEDSEEKTLRVRVEHLFRNASAELTRQQGVKIGHFVAGVEPAGNIGAVVVAAAPERPPPLLRGYDRHAAARHQP